MFGSDAWRFAGLLFAATASVAAPAAASGPVGAVLACSIERKHECGRDGCVRPEEGFVAAERYRINTASRHVTACLWSTCFAGKASTWSARDGETQGAGRLRAENGNGFLTLTFMLLADGRFSTVYSSGETAVPVSFGQCEQVPPKGARKR